MSAPLGPRQHRARALGHGWSVHAEERLTPCNELRWDVWLEHESRPAGPAPGPVRPHDWTPALLETGRIPAGPNLHAEPEAEMDRLARVLLPPAR